MSKLYYKVDQHQYDLLCGLRYWIANKCRMRERYGDDEPELERCHKTICSIFDELDKNGVPYWVQNTICMIQEDWRHYLTSYTYQDLEARGIDCSAVSCR